MEQCQVLWNAMIKIFTIQIMAKNLKIHLIWRKNGKMY